MSASFAFDPTDVRQRYRFSNVYWNGAHRWVSWGRLLDSRVIPHPKVLHPPCCPDLPWEGGYDAYWTGAGFNTTGWAQGGYSLRDREDGTGLGVKVDVSPTRAIGCERINMSGPHDSRYNSLYSDGAAFTTGRINYAYWSARSDVLVAHRWSLLDGVYAGQQVPPPFGD